jgi:hypothetical protein
LERRLLAQTASCVLVGPIFLAAEQDFSAQNRGGRFPHLVTVFNVHVESFTGEAESLIRRCGGDRMPATPC